MKLQILGSGAAEGIPAPFCSCETCERIRKNGGIDFRTRSSALVDDCLMLDVSPDTFCNIWRFHIDLRKLKAIVCTHPHIDHLAAAELCLRAPDYCDVPEGDLIPFLGSRACVEEVQRQLIFDLGRIPELFAFQVLEPFVPVNAAGYQITPLPARHTPAGQAFLLLVETPTQRYLHCMDTAMPSEETLAYLQGLHLDGITMDCTYGDACAPGDSHMDLQTNIRLKERLLAQGSASKNTVFLLSHISHHATLSHAELSALAGIHGMAVAHDGFTLQL